jgi:glyoxylase-like metal-dependent hydrolase (beta-lactamase superfamily II)
MTALSGTNLHTRVAPGVHAIDSGFEGVPLNVYAVEGGVGWTLLDAGVVSSPPERIFPALRELGAAPADVRLLINTHVHHDHRGGNGALKRANPALRLAVPAVEAGWAESSARYVIQTQTGAFPGVFEPSDAAQERIIRLCGEDVVVDVRLRDGDVLDAGGGRSLHVLDAPGHSPGHVVLHDPAASILFAGDAIQGDGCRIAGNTWLFPFYDSVETYADSLAKLARLDAERVCTAHYGVLDRDGTAALLATSRSFMGELDAHLKALLSSRQAIGLKAAVASTLEAFTGYRDAVGAYTTVAAHLDHMVKRGSVTAFVADQTKHWQLRRHRRS